MYKILMSDEDRKAVRYILTLYKTNTYKYLSKLELSKGVCTPSFTKDRVDELINLFDMKGAKKL